MKCSFHRARKWIVSSMNTILNNKVLQFRSDTVDFLRKQYNLDKPGSMDQAVDVLDDWIKKQNHFTRKDYSRDYLERSIIFLKGSVERAKVQMEKICTLRTTLPNFFEKCNASEDFKELHEIYYQVILPKLTEDHYRVLVIKYNKPGFTTKMFFDSHSFGTIICEYLKAHDYCNGYIGILDFRDISIMELLTNMNPVTLNQMATIVMEGYGMRVKGIHCISSSKTVETIVNILKKMLGAKVGSRFHVHTSLDTLYEFLPKEILPPELGGCDKSLAVISREFIDLLSTPENVEYTKELSKAVINESCRLPKEFNDDALAGTFRSLNVD